MLKRFDLSALQFRMGISAVALSALSGCAIVPGLQIDVKSPPQSEPQYRVVDQDNNSKLIELVAPQGELKGYRLVTVTAESLLAEKAAAAASARDASNSHFLAELKPQDYKVGPGDILQIIVWDHPELTSPTGDFRDPVSSGRLVSAGGRIFYPYVGDVKVEGLTSSEIRDELSKGLSRVITKPQVDVRVVAYRAQRIQIAGEVAQPGLVTLDDTSKGVLEAINERGGLSSSASKRGIILIRGGISYPISLSSLLAGGTTHVNPALLPGDIVQVLHKDNEQVFVLGEVANQSALPLEQPDVSLTQVLAKSGGLDQLRADDSGLLIFRRAQKDNDYPTVYVLDISQPLGLLLAGEFVMESKDVVYVKATGFAKYNSIIAQLLPTISAIFQIDSLVRRY